jgi:hypothetical protein
MPDGGRLMFGFHAVEFEAQFYATHLWAEARDFVFIEVADTARGMPPEARDRIFAPFVTTEEMGKEAGLSLINVHGFAKQNSGLIHVHSESGLGASFHLHLPVDDSGAGPQTSKAAEELGITPRMARYKMTKLGVDNREAHSDTAERVAPPRAR